MSDGTVKVLDFGLAKAFAGDESSPDLSHVPTMTVTELRDGAIVGTPPYMSPEQARGQAIDKRTDIWAFGCVLYAMLAGRLAFSGDTLSDTIAKILEREPDWSALPAQTPVSIRRLLQRCLEKDPKRRLHDIADARIEIDDALTASATTDAPNRDRRRPLWIAVAIALVAMTLATVLALVWSRRPAPTADPDALHFFGTGPGDAIR